VVLVDKHEPVSSATTAQRRHQKLSTKQSKNSKPGNEEMKRMGVRPFN
jgi:hypothetical protein